jgi:hypothetical protein
MSRAFLIAGLFFPSVCAMLGCDSRNSTEAVDTSSPAKGSVHDFGVVPPGALLTHRFTISNPTQRQWRLVKVTRSCACTVVATSSDICEPGGSQTFEFSYQAPTVIADDQQTVTLEFEGPANPRVPLTVKARTRKALSIFPDKLDFGQVAIGSQESRSLRIENCSDVDWDGLLVQGLPPSLQLLRMKKSNEVNEVLPRQVWTAEFRLDGSGLDIGTGHAELVIHSNGRRHEGSVSVVYHITDDIWLAPTVLNFGRMEPGKWTETRSIVLEIKGQYRGTLRPIDVKINCAAGDEIKCDWKILSEESWLAQLSLRSLTPTSNLVRGCLTVRFPEGIRERVVEYAGWMERR